MLALKSDIVPFTDLAAALDCLPPDRSGLSRDDTLALWQTWHGNGSLQLGRVKQVMSDGSAETAALGITLWISDSAVQELSRTGEGCCTHRLYLSALRGLPWPLQTADIHSDHDRRELNLMVLHFWSRIDVNSQDFQPVFLQAHMLFRDLHQGFGVKALYQELPRAEAPFLSAAGMDVIHNGTEDDPAAMAWMGITREQAMSKAGSTFSFLFFSPPRRLALQPAVQRMLGLAVRQITDDEIAAALGYSRDYVRKLWTQAYDSMQAAGILNPVDAPAANSASPVRGRERRRTALEFLRANPHEMRPGLLHTRRLATDLPA